MIYAAEAACAWFGGLQVAEATMGRLKADGAVSRRPATLTVAAEQEAPSLRASWEI